MIRTDFHPKNGLTVSFGQTVFLYFCNKKVV